MKKLFIFIAAVMSCFFMSSTAETPVNYANSESPPAINARLVPQIRCDRRLGTGFFIDERTIVTAEHVVRSNSTCVIHSSSPRQVELRAIDRDVGLDFATLRSQLRSRSSLPISCERIGIGETVWMIGYAEGANTLTINAGIGTRYYTNSVPRQNPDNVHPNQRVLEGRAISGMSGGPVINARGEVIAFVSAYSLDQENRALVKELRDTPLCRSK